MIILGKEMQRPGDKGPTGGEIRLARRQGAADKAVVSRPFEEITSPALKKVFEVWQSKRSAPDQLPPAGAFDIFDYRAAVGNINLIEVRQNPLDFIFRVHSFNGATYVGRDLTGRSVDDYPNPEYRDFVRAAFTQATLARQPQIIIEKLDTAEGRRMRWEGIIMPLQNDVAEVTRLVVAFEILH